MNKQYEISLKTINKIKAGKINQSYVKKYMIFY